MVDDMGPWNQIYKEEFKFAIFSKIWQMSIYKFWHLILVFFNI